MGRFSQVYACIKNETTPGKSLFRTYEKLTIGQGKIREERHGEADPPCREVKTRDGIGEPAIAQDYEGSDTQAIGAEHRYNPREVSNQSASFAQTIPIEKGHECEQIVKELNPADPGATEKDGHIEVWPVNGGSECAGVSEPMHEQGGERENK